MPKIREAGSSVIDEEVIITLPDGPDERRWKDAAHSNQTHFVNLVGRAESSLTKFNFSYCEISHALEGLEVRSGARRLTESV